MYTDKKVKAIRRMKENHISNKWTCMQNIQLLNMKNKKITKIKIGQRI